MKFIIFFICIPLVYSEKHMFISTYTELNGQTIEGTPEFSAVTTLDDHQIDYYDSNIKKLIPRQDWMNEFASEELWKKYTEVREKLQQIYRNNSHVLMETFNQSHGLHTYQRMYGCEWDDKSGDSDGFDQYSYDGEDFISLDLKENRYTAHVEQVSPTVKKWNNDRAKLEYLKQYYDYKCVYWLKELLHLSKATSEKTDPPKVSLLQKYPDYYTCQVTGFLFRNTSISWRKNGQAMNDSSNLVETGDTLPNEDGTFQRTVVLHVLPDEHKSLTEPIQKSMTVNEIKRNKSASDASYIMYLVIVIILVIVGLIALCVQCKLRKELKYSSKYITYSKTQSRRREHAHDLHPLLSTHSYKRSSPPEA